MKPHRTDLVSLIFGVLFLGAAGLWLLAQFVHLHVAAVALLVAIGLVLVGVFGLTYTLVADRRFGQGRTDEPPNPPEEDHPGV